MLIMPRAISLHQSPRAWQKSCGILYTLDCNGEASAPLLEVVLILPIYLNTLSLQYFPV
jgi:hypothetical protein